MCLETGGGGKGQFFVPSIMVSTFCHHVVIFFCMGGLNEENKIDKVVNYTVHKDDKSRCSQSYIPGTTEQNYVQLLASSRLMSDCTHHHDANFYISLKVKLPIIV